MWDATVAGVSVLLIVYGGWLVARSAHPSAEFRSSSSQRLTGIGAMLMGVGRFLPELYGVDDVSFLGGSALFLYGLAQRNRSAEHVPPAV